MKKRIISLLLALIMALSLLPVGVLAADMILNLPDYTAAERTFQLLTQVAPLACGAQHR